VDVEMMVQAEEILCEEEHPDTTVKSPAQPIHANALVLEHVDQVQLSSTLSKNQGGRGQRVQRDRSNHVREYEDDAPIHELLKLP
tara:strand:- start:48 stop:302 length:255 start_codon:yes stop_codon:yes gene_type:complete